MFELDGGWINRALPRRGRHFSAYDRLIRMLCSQGVEQALLQLARSQRRPRCIKSRYRCAHSQAELVESWSGSNSSVLGIWQLLLCVALRGSTLCVSTTTKLPNMHLNTEAPFQPGKTVNAASPPRASRLSPSRAIAPLQPALAARIETSRGRLITYPSAQQSVVGRATKSRHPFDDLRRSRSR